MTLSARLNALVRAGAKPLPMRKPDVTSDTFLSLNRSESGVHVRLVGRVRRGLLVLLCNESGKDAELFCFPGVSIGLDSELKGQKGWSEWVVSMLEDIRSGAVTKDPFALSRNTSFGFRCSPSKPVMGYLLTLAGVSDRQGRGRPAYAENRSLGVKQGAWF